MVICVPLGAASLRLGRPGMGRARVALSLARGSPGPSAPRTQLPCPWARPATSYRVTLGELLNPAVLSSAVL